MPKDKSETYHRIIPAAKKEFMEKGFERASLRSIASEAGISAAGLYRHFSNKEAMFDALLQPLFEQIDMESEKHKRVDYELLEANELNQMWQEQGDSSLFLQLLYTYYDEFKLLLCHAQGTRHEDFIHDFVTMKERETFDYLNEARRKGIPVNDILPKELHLLLSAYYTAVFEVIVHNFTRDEAEHYFKTLRKCFYPGFKDVLGL